MRRTLHAELLHVPSEMGHARWLMLADQIERFAESFKHSAAVDIGARVCEFHSEAAHVVDFGEGRPRGARRCREKATQKTRKCH
jgi:hypothetical protein